MKSFKTYLKESNDIHIWLDDERNPLDLYIQKHFGSTGKEIWVKNYKDCIDLLKTNNINSISFDHDLGNSVLTGYDVAKWIEKSAFNKILKPLKWKIHTSNPQGRKNIENAMKNADKFWGVG